MNNNRSTALERSVKITLGWGVLNRCYGISTSPSASVMAHNIQLFDPREGFQTHQWIITGNKKITGKYYNETKMRTQQKQRAVNDIWRLLGCLTTPLEHWSKRKPTVEPRWSKKLQLVHPWFTYPKLLVQLEHLIMLLCFDLGFTAESIVKWDKSDRSPRKKHLIRQPQEELGLFHI